MLNSIHNHDRLQKRNHARIRRYFMTFEIRENIKLKHKIKKKSKKILNFIWNKYDDENFNNSIIDSKNIYNALSLIREQKLKNIIAIQILNHELHDNLDKWFVRVNKNSNIQKITHLFWINKISMNTFFENNEIILLNCIYKINRYKMFFCIFTRMTYLNISFYFDICLLKNEKFENYKWFFDAFKELYKHLNIFLSNVWFSNDELNIFAILRSEISLAIVHILCVWYIENNIINNCRKHLNSKKNWVVFFDDKKQKITKNMHKILYVKIENDLNLQWQLLQNKYNLMNSTICEYLSNEILSKKNKWNRIWIDRYMHFNNIAIFKFERANHDLKN